MKLGKTKNSVPAIRCAIYTRKSTEEGLHQEFNSLDAQRESGEAYVASQRSEGWECLPDRYDDGGYTGGNMDRPALTRLMADIEAGKIDCVVVYKVDRLSRSLLDFARMMETFEKHKVAFVSVTQQFNTTTSMGRLMLNVLLSFAQFEREIISERTRDKIAATRRKGKWCGGMPLLGYNVVETKLVIMPDEAEQVRQIFALYLEYDGLMPVVEELARRGWHTKRWTTKKGTQRGGRPFDRNSLWYLLTNVTYAGKITYKDEIHAGIHDAIMSEDLWSRVQARLRHNGRSGGTMARNKFGAVLKGLLHCAACGCAMSPTHSTRNKTKRYRYYVCNAAQKKGWRTCPSRSVPAGEIERFVVDQIACVGKDSQLVAETVRQVRRNAQQRLEELAVEERRIQRELTSHQGQLQNLVKVPSVGHEVAAAQFADVLERIAFTERRLVEIGEEADRLRRESINEGDAGRALAEFRPVWESLSLREQGRLLQLLIERIDYDGRNGTLAIKFHPSGISSLVNNEFQGDAA